jgi:HK97 family phage major capsid protein
MTFIQDMTRDQAVARMKEINREMTPLGDKPRLRAADDQRFNDLDEEFDSLVEHVGRLDRAAELASAGRAGGRYRVERGSAGDDNRDRDGVRSAALRCLDDSVRDGTLAASGAEVVERLVETGSARSRSWAARWVNESGSEDYRNAFAKRLIDPDTGHLQWTEREAQAWRTVTALQAERSMSSTDTAGGFLLPFQLDPTILLTNAGTNNPLVQISRVVQTTSDVWNGVSSAGVTAEWLPEASEAADASPVLAQPAIPAYKASVFCPYSVELEGDAANLLTELGMLLHDGANRLTSTAYTLGSGSGQPTGVITALAGGSSVVNSVGTEALAASDVFNVQQALPPRFQANAQWCANLSTLNQIRQFETVSGALKFPSAQDNPPSLLGRSIYENSEMDGLINPAATESNLVLVYGDFSNFVITQRVGQPLRL